MNPFDKKSDRQIAFEELKKMVVGETIQADIGKGTIASYRANVSDASRAFDMAFRTKVSDSGELWVKRIA